MGLDISVLTNVHKIYDPEGEEAKGRNVIKLYNIDALPDSCEEGYYSYDESSWIYGSPYSTYNHFRDQLCRMVIGVSYDSLFKTHPEPNLEMPFAYIFWHGDNEGDFTGDQLKKTAKDFKDHLITVAEKAPEDDHFINWYDAMMRGFMRAVKENGAINYH